MPKVSVIIPTYNRAVYICEAIDSVLNQTFQDFEIIVVDDGSNDNTKGALAKYNGRIKFFYQENKGVSCARNMGIKEAKGEYIAFLDSDDIWVSQKLEMQINAIEANNRLSLICGQVQFINESGSYIDKILPKQGVSSFKEAMLYDVIITPTVLVKKECLMKVGGFNENLIVGEDFDLWLSIALSDDFLFIPEVLANVRSHKNRLSRNIEWQYKNHIKTYKKYCHKKRVLNFYEMKLNLAQQYYQLARYYIETAHWWLAFVMILKSTFNFPLIGLSVYKNFRQSLAGSLLRIIKPYLVMFYCIVRSVAKIFKFKRPATSEIFRLGIDARCLTTKSKSGVQNYIIKLVEEMSNLKPNIKIFLFYPSLFSQRSNLPKFCNYNIRYIGIPISEELNCRHFNWLWYDFLLPLYGKILQIEVFHGPTEIIPLNIKCTKVVTIHHVWMEELEKLDQDILRRRKLSALYADKIITVSDVSKQNIIRLWDIPEDKITVIYNGFNDKIFHGNYGNDNAKEEIILFVGSSYPRKNILGLLQAYVILRQQKNISHKLYLVGKEKTQDPRCFVEENNLENEVKFVVNADESALDKFYRKAEVLVFPSFEEGFGMPLLEALFRGTPVVASNIPVFREIAGDCPFYVNPHSPDEIARGIWEALSNPNIVKEKIVKATALTEKYSWKKAAQETQHIYETLIPRQNILYYEPSSGFGGSANALANLVNRLNNKKFNPVIAIKNYGFQIEKIKNSEKLKLTDYGEPERLSNFGFFISFISKVLPEAIKLYFMIKKKKISLVHVNTNIISGIPAIIASKVAGIPCICHIRQTRELIKREKIFAKWVYKFIVLNSTVYEMLKQTVPQEKINIIHDGVDLKEFIQIGTGALRKEFNLDSEPVIGIIGRIIKGKGHKEFILTAEEVLRIRPNVHFVIVGDAKGGSDRYYNDIIDLVSKEHLKNNVIFTGWRTDVKGILNDIDLVVQPYTLPEGLPNILIEAMALGKPVVTTNIPGPSEIVADGQTGFLVPSKDPLALAEAILKLLDNPQLAKQMGEAGRKRVEQLFNIQDTVKKIQELYLQVLNK
jgi:glycosyltransferase involved in cell wall biosynthesis